MKLSKIVTMALFATSSTNAQQNYADCKQSEGLEIYLKSNDEKKQYDAKVIRNYKKDDDGAITNEIESEGIELYPYKKGKSCSGSPDSYITIDPDTIANWNYEDNVCWNSGEKPSRAAPNLRSCFGSTENACCNYIEDQVIGGVYTDFVPSPCQGDYGELQLLQCLGCNGNTNSFIIKPEATMKYVTVMNYLINYQKEILGLKGKAPFEKGSTLKTGHIKICSHWLKRFWTGENVPVSEMTDKDDKSKLSKATEIFDNCGVYDKDGNSITRPSTNPIFSDALTFLEWYGVTLLDQFGFVIVDNMAAEGSDNWLDNYKDLRDILRNDQMLGDLDDQQFQNEFEKTFRCFDSAKKLGSTVTALFIVLGYIIF